MPLTKDSIAFLIENRLRNDKEWFTQNRKQFDALVTMPMRAISEALAPAALAVDPLVIAEPKVGKTLSRVYRDTRFTHDKSLFRDVMWVIFMRDRKQFYCPPALFFEFSAKGFRYGCGYYSADPKIMTAVRELLAQKDKTAMAAVRAYESQTLFTMAGDAFKRPRYTHENATAQTFMNNRTFCFLHESDNFDLLFSDEITQTVGEGFLQAKPLYALFVAASKRASETRLHPSALLE